MPGSQADLSKYQLVLLWGVGMKVSAAFEGEAVCQYLLKLEVRVPFDPAFPLLGI